MADEVMTAHCSQKRNHEEYNQDAERGGLGYFCACVRVVCTVQHVPMGAATGDPLTSNAPHGVWLSAVGREILAVTWPVFPSGTGLGDDDGNGVVT